MFHRSLIKKLLADDREQRRLIQKLMNRVDALEYDAKFHAEELLLDEAAERKLKYLKPEATSIKSLLFGVIDYIGLMPVYDQGRKPGFQLTHKPQPEPEKAPEKEPEEDKPVEVINNKLEEGEDTQL